MAGASLRYQGHRDPQDALRMRVREVAASRVRFGYRRLTVLLRREGWRVNAKRIYRLYTENGGDRSEPAVEYGFHECARGGWPLVSDSDRRGPVQTGMSVLVADQSLTGEKVAEA